MAIRKKRKELLRLQKGFEDESNKYHDLTLTLLNIEKGVPIDNKNFHEKNHAISLCQYYGRVSSEESINGFVKTLREITDYGIKNTEFSAFAVIDGDTTELFKRMAYRAGTLFSEKESLKIENVIKKELVNPDPSGQQVFIINGNPLAVWINFILYHLSSSYPNRIGATRLEVDPFTASLTAIDYLLEEGTIVGKGKSVLSGLENTKFKVALSFPGEKREYIREVVEALCKIIGKESVFYDHFYTSELARPNLDTLLQSVYHKNSDLVVAFLCEEYQEKEWCGLEWRAIKDLIKKKEDNRIMLMRFDNAEIEGVFTIDGYVDCNNFSPNEIAKFIVERIRTLNT